MLDLFIIIICGLAMLAFLAYAFGGAWAISQIGKPPKRRRWDGKDSFIAMFVALFVIAIVLMIGSLIWLVVA